MAFEGFSSTPLRRPGPRASSLAPASGLAWAAGHLYSAADTGAIKCACLHRDTLFLSTRKGIWRVDCSTGRCVRAQTQPNHTCAPVVLPHHVTNTAGSNSNYYNRLPLTHFNAWSQGMKHLWDQMQQCRLRTRWQWCRPPFLCTELVKSTRISYQSPGQPGRALWYCSCTATNSRPLGWREVLVTDSRR